jgi:STE24 endopeptidase
MASGLAARLRDAAQRTTRRASLQDALVAVQFLAIVLALGLPVEVFAGFVRYREAGLSHAGFWPWLYDYVLQWAVDLVFYVVGIVAIVALIRRQPRAWPALATIVYVALYATYTLASPIFIEPLFNQYTQLPDGPARDRILSLARANGVPADGVYVKDASRQSVILNASVSGIAGTARITLDDNTVQTTPPAELEMVMAHEIGHYVLRHVFKETVFFGLVMAAGFVFIAWALRALVARHGERWLLSGVGDAATIPLLWFLVALWGFVSMPVNNSITRADEAEADLYGLNASQQPLGLAEFMLRDADVRPLAPTRFVEWALYTHPAPASRIATAMRWRAEHMPR